MLTQEDLFIVLAVVTVASLAVSAMMIGMRPSEEEDRHQRLLKLLDEMEKEDAE